MRFQVPQFIEVEDKLFGPFTFKQFVYLAGAAGVVVALFTLLPKFLAFLVSIPVVALAGALTFLKINNRPFILMLEAFFITQLVKSCIFGKKQKKSCYGCARTGGRHSGIHAKAFRQQTKRPFVVSQRYKSGGD